MVILYGKSTNIGQMCISLAVEGAIKWLFFTLDDQISENMFIVVGTNLCHGPGKFINDYVIIDLRPSYQTQMFNEEMTWSGHHRTL